MIDYLTDLYLDRHASSVWASISQERRRSTGLGLMASVGHLFLAGASLKCEILQGLKGSFWSQSGAWTRIAGKEVRHLGIDMIHVWEKLANGKLATLACRVLLITYTQLYIPLRWSLWSGSRLSLLESRPRINSFDLWTLKISKLAQKYFGLD
jgi:hypothetical protein